VALVSASPAWASPAAAAVRYAVPSGGATSGPCDAASPCTIVDAVNVVADPGDEVVVLPGTYPLPDRLEVANQVDLHGQEGAAPPLLTGAFASYMVRVTGTATRVANLELENNAGSATTLLSTGHPTATGSVIDRVRAVAHGGNGIAIGIGSGDTLTNSVAWTTHPSNTTAVHGLGDPGSALMEIRNVTAVNASPAGIGVFLGAVGGADTVLMRNVIAPGSGTGIRAFAAGTGNSSTIDVDYSNFNVCEEMDSPGATATCAKGTHNQEGVNPAFVDLLAGDFHQRPTSPTIDAGFTTAANNLLDLDGDPRRLGAGTDIGADEFRIAPVAATSAPTAVAQSAATLHGSANPRGLATGVYFEYGTGTSYGSRTPTVQLGAGTADAPFAAGVTGLAAGTTYRYRAVATSSGGTSRGAAMTFATRPAPTPPGGGPDRLAPRVQSFSVTNKRFRRRTRFRYTLSEPARALITIERKTSGRRVGGRCRKATRRNRTRRRCTLHVRVGALSQQGRAGSNALVFAGRIAGRRVPFGSYRASLVATDEAGNASRPRRTSFRIVRGLRPDG
jgi:hypothetical protein